MSLCEGGREGASAREAFGKEKSVTGSGVYYIIPIMSMSILIGLALDYDIFLMSRVVEFRRKVGCKRRWRLREVVGCSRKERGQNREKSIKGSNESRGDWIDPLLTDRT